MCNVVTSLDAAFALNFPYSRSFIRRIGVFAVFSFGWVRKMAIGTDTMLVVSAKLIGDAKSLDWLNVYVGRISNAREMLQSESRMRVV